MLVSFQTFGAKAPVYFIHGITGIMPLGRFFAQSLGPDQPFYAINANGSDGHEITVKEMAHTYAEEIVDSQPNGPVFIAAMCAGGPIALEVVRELQARGREVGPVILVDPPPMPQGVISRNQKVDARNPLVASQLYQRVRGDLLNCGTQSYNHLPFAIDDEQQVHLATLAGVRVMVASCRHTPEIFTGAASVILSPSRAVGFFHSQMPWAKVLTGKYTAYVLPYDHIEMFRSGRHDLARVLKFILDGANEFRTPSRKYRPTSLEVG